jgi:hypothetical protein
LFYQATSQEVFKLMVCILVGTGLAKNHSVALTYRNGSMRGLCVAIIAIGIHIQSIACTFNEAAVQCVLANYANIVHGDWDDLF